MGGDNKEPPKFTFGEKPKDAQSAPAKFTFESKTDAPKPTFTFGTKPEAAEPAKAPEPVKFTFGQSQDNNGANKPVFSFGQNAQAKPTFSFNTT